MKNVLITGACINTGVSIVEKFASEGYNVAFTGRNMEKVHAKEKEYREKFPNVTIKGFHLDSLADDGSVDTAAAQEMFDELDKAGLAPDALVLNAADQGLGIKIFENELSDFVRVMNTNVVWNYFLCENAAKRMREKGGGSILFINSNTAYRAIPDRIAYISSKGGQLSMMRALALDLGKYNIRVNAILPGMIKTDRWDKNPEFYETVPSRFSPIREVITGEDIAEAAWFLSVNAPTTTGAELTLDGGNTIQLYPIPY